MRAKGGVGCKFDIFESGPWLLADNTVGYDQLHRIKNVNQHDIGTGNWSFASANDKFKEGFSYDGSGNILNLQRNNQSGNTMDNLGYSYNRDGAGKLINNRLAAVNDAVGVTNGNDIGNNSYSYDEIGNLKTDAAEGISNIDWSVYGKIKSISKNSGGINYTYDPSGNRVSKLYNGITTYCVRDAQGNSLAVYDNTGNTNNWREQQLYGSSRLGMWKPNLNLATANGSSIWNSYGLKFFELSNHLGNVMAVVSDNRLQTGSTYEPDVINSNDYYAFGGQMNGRDFTNPGAQAYRYGFNGKENDSETGTQDYGMRIYAPKLGRFLSVDPITKEYPWYTPYQFAGNKPIWAIDLDSAEEYIKTYKFEDGKATFIGKVDNSYVVSTNYVVNGSKGTMGVVYDKRTRKPMNPREVGQVQFQYVDNSGEKLNIRRNYKGEYVKGNNEFMAIYENGTYLPLTIGSNQSNYIGPGNLSGLNGKGDYRREPIDLVDAAAMMHDQAYDNLDAVGATDALFNTETLGADRKLRDAAKSVIANAKTEKTLDPYTGKLISKETVSRAKKVYAAFNFIVREKEKKIKNITVK